MSAQEPQTASVAEAREALQAAIEGLYQTFASYPLRPHVEGCAHCVSAQDEARLHSKPLRELTEDDLTWYAFKAMTTWGDVDDFRHFLPRLLELLALADLGVDPEVVLGKLTYAEWLNWPQAEKTVIEAYLEALWRYVLVCCPLTGDYGWGADECLCSIAQAADDLGPYLSIWRDHEDMTAHYHLAQLILANDDDLAHSLLANPFWQKRLSQMLQAIQWLEELATLQMLEQARDRVPKQFAQEFSESVEQLRQLRPDARRLADHS